MTLKINPFRLLIVAVTREYFSNLVYEIRKLSPHKKCKNINLDDISVKFEKTNPNLTGNISTNEERYILLDEFPVPQWLIINALLARRIAKEIHAKPVIFVFRRVTKLSKEVHAAFGLRHFMLIKLSLHSWRNLFKEYHRIIKFLDADLKLIDYKINEIPIGLDIYESILRLGYKTVNLKEMQTYRVIYLALKQYCFFVPLFEGKKVTAVVVSHDNYIGPGLMAHIAFHFKVPVILANTLSLSMPTKPFQLYEKFARFETYSREIPKIELNNGRLWAKSELDSRLNGEIGVGMEYQKKSAFNSEIIVRQTLENNRPKVLILAHDFFDNPHAYKRMLFDDFYMWLEYLAEIAPETNYDWYIKAHRDYSDLEYSILTDFVRRHPVIKMIDPETSYNQLRSEGVVCALTCYGSAGHELPLLGFTVINASYNPHVSYEFNIHASSVEEYKKIILDLDTHLLTSVDKNKIYEYYFIHKKFVDVDNFFGISQTEISKLSGDNPFAKTLLDYFVRNFEEINERVKNRLKEAITSKVIYAFELKMSEESRLLWNIEDSNLEFFEKMSEL